MSHSAEGQLRLLRARQEAKRLGNLVTEAALALAARIAAHPEIELLGFASDVYVTPWLLLHASLKLDAPYWAAGDLNRDTAEFETALRDSASWLGNGEPALYADPSGLPLWASLKMLPGEDRLVLLERLSTDREFVVYVPERQRAIAVSNDTERWLLFRFEVTAPGVRAVAPA